MKITILGSAGVRTPIILRSIIHRQEALQVSELALMDIDHDRMKILGALIDQIIKIDEPSFKVTQTTNAQDALSGADFVITTFRVGGIKQRMIDERIALNEKMLGQETTGAAGFALALRTIPVLMNYVELMKKVCPDAWLLNFANPSGMLTEVILRKTGWTKTVGICDGPSSMQRKAAEILQVEPDLVYMDYFGLNHLGWIRSIICNGIDVLPGLIDLLDTLEIEDLPFSTHLIRTLKMIPNEYLYYYYYAEQAVSRLIKAGKTRGEQLHGLNEAFFDRMRELIKVGDPEKLNDCYIDYQRSRWRTYMSLETGKAREANFKNEDFFKLAEGGYSGVALDIITALQGNTNKVMTLNVTNNESIIGMDADAVVEIPVVVGANLIRPMNIGAIPEHCLGLMNQVKSYERYTIEAALEGSYAKAWLALTIHPLIKDEEVAKRLLDTLIIANAELFPKLS